MKAKIVIMVTSTRRGGREEAEVQEERMPRFLTEIFDHQMLLPGIGHISS